MYSIVMMTGKWFWKGSSLPVVKRGDFLLYQSLGCGWQNTMIFHKLALIQFFGQYFTIGKGITSEMSNSVYECLW